MPFNDPLSHRILQHIADRRYRPRSVDALAQELGVGPDLFEQFNRSVQKLIDDGQVVRGMAQTIALPPPGREMTGLFRLNPRGFGFIKPDSPSEHGDLFVPPENTAGALTGDRVRAKVIHTPGRGSVSGRSPYVGRITQIVQRAENRYVGNLTKRGSHFFVEVDGKVLRDPVLIRDPHAKDAKPGDKVVIELVAYPRNDEAAEGVITEVLGERGEPNVETEAVIRSYGLRDAFPPEVVEEARQASKSLDPQAVPHDREDLTQQFILTIDPPDARDFDDAISIRRLGGEESGHSAASAAWELGVHIAHVSHFVQPGGAMDAEALKRGNSVYLPRRVLPMLPEVLSNGVCSLQEGVNRYCLSVFIRYDEQGHVLSARFARTVIRSAKRLTYLEAQALIDDDLRQAVKHAKGEPKYPRKVIETLKLMDELSKVIRARRLRDGMIVLGLPEVELVFDDSGRVTDAVPEDNAYTHTLIEMFMVEANEAAARLFHKHNVPMIRRIHPDPPSHDMADLRRFARVAGFNIPLHPTRKELQQLLDSVRGKPAQQAVHLAVLQTLSKAEYSPQLLGHFALASEHYTHFTSPIRRYADLLVHRGLDAYLDAHGNRFADDSRLHDEGKLHEIGSHISSTERKAEAAERDLRYYFVLDLLASHLGDDYEGTVTGVTGSGVFIQLDRFLVDGFIRIHDLPASARDLWRLNPNTGALVAQRSGKTITIGDRFTVRIANVKPEARTLDLVIVHEIAGASHRPAHPKREQAQGAKKSHQHAMKLKKQRRNDRKHKRRR